MNFLASDGRCSHFNKNIKTDNIKMFENILFIVISYGGRPREK